MDGSRWMENRESCYTRAMDNILWLSFALTYSTLPSDNVNSPLIADRAVHGMEIRDFISLWTYI